MLIEVSAKEYKQYFCSDNHPFISEQFVELNKHKVDKLVRLVTDSGKISIGLVAGIKENMFLSPFSSPFGGFHYRSEHVFISEIEQFLLELRDYVKINNFSKILLSLPPSIYQKSFNAKVINSFIRLGYEILLPEITCFVDLSQFNGRFSYKMSRNNYNTALRHNLIFNALTNQEEKEIAYKIVYENRIQFGREIHMTFDELMQTNNLWPIDFFGVNDSEGQMVASAIFYQFTKDIAYGVFWGDSCKGRSLKSMDFLSFNLWSYYKTAGYKYIDLSTSTENGLPNEGQLWFKEVHECASSIRFCFSYNIQ